MSDKLPVIGLKHKVFGCRFVKYIELRPWDIGSSDGLIGDSFCLGSGDLRSAFSSDRILDFRYC